jgi:hypothetical protein
MSIASPEHKPKGECRNYSKQKNQNVESEPRLYKVEDQSGEPAVIDPWVSIVSKRERVGSGNSVEKSVFASFKVKPKVRIVERF